jgi:hypothetical protein
MDSSSLYETGDEKTTTQYLVISAHEHPTLLQASVTIDPYVKLFSPYRREFLNRLRHPSGKQAGQQDRTAFVLRRPALRHRGRRLSQIHCQRL